MHSTCKSQAVWGVDHFVDVACNSVTVSAILLQRLNECTFLPNLYKIYEIIWNEKDVTTKLFKLEAHSFELFKFGTISKWNFEFFWDLQCRHCWYANVSLKIIFFSFCPQLSFICISEQNQSHWLLDTLAHKRWLKIIIKFLDKVKLHWVNKFRVETNKTSQQTDKWTKASEKRAGERNKNI